MDLEHAYLHKMIDFGLPEMAVSQASDLTARNPKDGEAWAVVAYMNAKRAQGGPATAAALVNIQLAVRYAPDSPFVIRTAAQLVAWYDVRADKSQVDAAARAAVDDLQLRLANNTTYADAYMQARTDYQQMAAQAAEPGQVQAAPPVTQATPDYGTGSVVTIPQYPAYPQSYYAYPAPYYSATPYDNWWYPSGYYNSWWWPGFYGGIVIGDFDHHHDDFHHHRGDFDHRGGDFDHRHSGSWDSTRTVIRSNTGRTTIDPAMRSGATRGSFVGSRYTAGNVPSLSGGRTMTPRTTTAVPSRTIASPSIRSATPTIRSAPTNAASVRSLSSPQITVPTRVNTVREAPHVNVPVGTPRFSGPSLGGRVGTPLASPHMNAPVGGGGVRSSGGHVGGGAVGGGHAGGRR
jgi:hypothetical protein